jgi:hypothetical protein
MSILDLTGVAVPSKLWERLREIKIAIRAPPTDSWIRPKSGNLFTFAVGRANGHCLILDFLYDLTLFEIILWSVLRLRVGA